MTKKCHFFIHFQFTQNSDVTQILTTLCSMRKNLLDITALWRTKKKWFFVELCNLYLHIYL